MHHDKVLDILCKLADFVFKGGTSDYIIIKQGCLSLSSKKRGHHFVLLTLYLKEQ